MGARYPGSEGHATLQRWLAESLAARGWETKSQSFAYRGATLTNITGTRRPSPGPLIILGAHYDTRRLADRDPVSPNEPVPGANDGASGVAVLVELARVLGQQEATCDLRLAFFDGEDNGDLDGWEWAAGSRMYAAALEREPLAVVIVDMVGDRDLALPVERNSSPDLVDEIWSAAEEAGSTAFRRDAGPSVLDDHTPFLESGWRAVDIIDLTYPAWHTTGDTLDKVSAESLDQVGEALWLWLERACLPLEGR
jgi:Zn-dependent M28 family amino/carboxypeptidase